MGMFQDLMGKIFAHPSASTPAASGASQAPAEPANAPAASPSVDPLAPSEDIETMSVDTTPVAAAGDPVDVNAILCAFAAENPEKLDWKHSIVDLLKLLDMDSSLAARRTLAKELHYSGDEHNTSAMNQWLQKAVFQKLAENGGMVPKELAS